MSGTPKPVTRETGMFAITQWQPIHPALRPYDPLPTCRVCGLKTHTYDQLVKCLHA